MFAGGKKVTKKGKCAKDIKKKTKKKENAF